MNRVPVRQLVKHAIAAVLYYSGLLRVWQAIALRRKTVVLMYHRVLPADECQRTGSHPGIVVERETFARQMSVLKRHFSVLSLDRFREHLERREPLPDSSCLITFDDGWSDNFTHALPVLREHGLPATIFLPVDYIGGRRLFWRESLTHLLASAWERAQAGPASRSRLAALLEPVGLSDVLDLPPQQIRAQVVERVDVANLTWDVGTPLVEALTAELGTSVQQLDTPDCFVDWDQVKTMAGQGVTFGGHGAEHRRLTEVSLDSAGVEVARSRAVLSERLPGPPLAFSYPNGCWSPEIAAMVRASGYSLAFTSRAGFVDCDAEWFALKRVNINQDSTGTPALFLARVMRLF